MKCIIQPIKGEGWLPRLYSNKHEAQWNVMHIYIRQGTKVVKPKNIKSNRKQELSTSAILSIFNSATLIFFLCKTLWFQNFQNSSWDEKKILKTFSQKDYSVLEIQITENGVCIGKCWTLWSEVFWYYSALLNVSGILPIIPVFLGDFFRVLAWTV